MISHDMANKNTQSNELIISNIKACLDWLSDVIWHHYDIISLNLFAESKFHQFSSQSENNSIIKESDKMTELANTF